jgi:F420-dependent oxidoreductase-like protein
VLGLPGLWVIVAAYGVDVAPEQAEALRHPPPVAEPLRIGVVVPNQRATVASVQAHLVRLEQLGLDSAWMPGIPNGPDVLTLLAVAGQATEHLELGTAIVPTHPRHPVALAAQALTVDDALGGRLTLGVGVSHEKVIDGQLGLTSIGRSAMREYLSILRPLLAEQRVDFHGETMRTRIRLDASVSGWPPPPVLLAALGEQMLRVAGSLADGFVSWMTGLRTLEDHSIPVITAAAREAGRPAPRIMVGLPILLTDDAAAGRARAGEEFAVYGRLPSYRAMLEAEGATSPGDIAVVGDEASIAGTLKRVEEMGATDFQATPSVTRRRSPARWSSSPPARCERSMLTTAAPLEHARRTSAGAPRHLRRRAIRLRDAPRPLHPPGLGPGRSGCSGRPRPCSPPDATSTWRPTSRCPPPAS